MIDKKFKPSLASEMECSGCMACIDACHHSALSVEVGSDGHYYPHFLVEKCVQCGACEKVCPIKADIKYGENIGISEPFGVWSRDKELSRQSASGGAFAAIAAYVLGKGGYVVGAISEGDTVKHVIINSLDQLWMLQGSKYIQSNISGIYREVKKLLVSGKQVLFTGTGCQVAALLCFLKKKYNNLFTIDLICAGVPSRLLITRFCEEEKVKPLMIRWRDKENGWQHGLQLTILSSNSSKKCKTENCFFGGGFLGNLTSRYSCYNCKFTGTDRKSDLTIGDFWGCQNWKEQQYDGISLLIVHSSAGKELMRKSNLEVNKVTWRECISFNPRIVTGKNPLRWTLIERSMINFFFQKLSYKTLNKVYAGSVKRSDLLWLPYKILTNIRWRLTNLLVKRKINKILKKL